MKPNTIARAFLTTCMAAGCTLSLGDEDHGASAGLIHHEHPFITYRIPKDTMDFQVGKVPPADADFYLNGNFFHDQPIGLVVINGIRRAKRAAGGGFFYVRKGKPYVRALECPTMTEYASQSILWGIHDGTKNERLMRQAHAREPTYRTLIGENDARDIVVVASNRAGLVTIQEIISFALKRGIREAVLFDGGSSVEYKFTDGARVETFKAMNGLIKRFKRIDEPPVFITGNFKGK